MKSESSREEALFQAAIRLAGPARSAFLDQACTGDPGLRARLESLVSAHEAEGDVLATEVDAARPTIAVKLAENGTEETVGQMLGRYKLLERVGEGGCGVVYVADQTEPVRRRVALKVIKLGMDTKQVVARFEAERQALAMMDHSNIAKVLDAGSTEAGRPFFVMELVRGVPITSYCDTNNLSTKARLDLFIKVCQAIQHAHQKGIIHRDIKPSNILVTVNDGVPVPKVIDFGIAKATEGRLTDSTIYTQLHQFIGTPAYMSPEQAEMTSLDIDTRSDIYSLGVLLYELLSGRTPFDARELMSAGIDAMRKVIREQEPQRPSTKLATLQGAELTTTSKRRSADMAKLMHQVQGDLDWIVMKCLEKDRTRRYETANGLAADLTRHLDNEPIIARPPSQWYRFQKTVRRNRGAALAALSIFLILIAAVGFTTSAFLSERKARLRAAEAERIREVARRAQEAETLRADTVANFVIEFFDAVIPDLNQSGHSDAINQLFVVADRLASRLTNAPRAEAELRLKVGDGYAVTLRDLTTAEPQFRAVERIGASLGEAGKHFELFARDHLEGLTMWRQQDTNSAHTLMLIAEEAMRQDPAEIQIATHALSHVARFHSYFGDPFVAETAARKVLELTPKDSDFLRSRMWALEVLARMASKRGSPRQAQEASRQLFGMLSMPSRAKGPEKSPVLKILQSLLMDGFPPLPRKESIQEIIDSLPVEDYMSRSCLGALLGIASARDGDWKGGLELLGIELTNSVNRVGLYEATFLSALIGDKEQYRTLCVSGLARFANGADPDASRMLVEPVLILPPDTSLLPTIRQLIGRARQGAPWTQMYALLPQALLAYHAGQYEDASRFVDAYLHEGGTLFGLGSGFDANWASGWFLRAAIEMKRGHLTEAQRAYREGLRLHPTNLRKPGTEFVGNDDFGAACMAELLRRQISGLLQTKPQAKWSKEHGSHETALLFDQSTKSCRDSGQLMTSKLNERCYPDSPSRLRRRSACGV